jgi:hypothetical protein
MPKARARRALAEKRPFLLASIVAALAFYYLRSGPWPELYLIPVKGAATALLAVYAWMRHSSQDARLLAVMLLIAAAGDMLAEFDGLAAHVLYFAYHLVALMLYLRHRRAVMARSQKGAVVALLLVPSAILYALDSGSMGGELVTVAYGLALGGMAAGAWASSLPRYRVGAGAVLFVVADLLYFAGTGPLMGSAIPQIFTWPLAYLGQLLVATGVMTTLRKRDPELRLVSSLDDFLKERRR